MEQPTASLRQKAAEHLLERLKQLIHLTGIPLDSENIISGLEAQVVHFKVQQKDSETRVHHLQDMLEAKDAELAASQAHIQDLENRLVRKENEKAFLAPFQSCADRLELKVMEKDMEIVSLKQEWQVRFMRTENEKAFLASLQSCVGSLEGKLIEKETKIEDLRKSLMQKENEKAFLASLQSCLGSLEGKLLEKDVKLASLQAHSKDLQKRLVQKENENASLKPLQSSMDCLESRLHQKQSCVDSLQMQIQDLRKRLLQKESETASLTQRFDAQPQVDGETWQFQGDSGDWISFPDCANDELMVKFKESHDVFQIIIDKRIYDIDFKHGVQKNHRTKKERKIRCFFGLPIHWKMTDEDALRLLRPGPPGSLSQPLGCGNVSQPMQKVTDWNERVRLQRVLNQSLSRHDGTTCSCIHGSSNFVVKEAYQIKSLHLWRRYQRFVRNIRDKHKLHGISPDTISPSLSTALTDFAKEINVDQAGNERLLLHGTKDFEVAKTIAAEGFDNRVAKDGLYGKGTYFAAQTCKAAQYATTHGRSQKASGQMGTMLLARVAIGDPFYTQSGCQSLSRPPEKNGVRADSIIARPGTSNGMAGVQQSHLEVVTFDPAQVYPEFIVRFQEQ